MPMNVHGGGGGGGDWGGGGGGGVGDVGSSSSFLLSWGLPGKLIELAIRQENKTVWFYAKQRQLPCRHFIIINCANTHHPHHTQLR